MSPRSHTAEATECHQSEKIEAIERELGDLNKVVFRGNGKPPLVSQVAVMDSKLSALCWLVAVTCGAVVAQIVALWFRFGK